LFPSTGDLPFSIEWYRQVAMLSSFQAHRNNSGRSFENILDGLREEMIIREEIQVDKYTELMEERENLEAQVKELDGAYDKMMSQQAKHDQLKVEVQQGWSEIELINQKRYEIERVTRQKEQNIVKSEEDIAEKEDRIKELKEIIDKQKHSVSHIQSMKQRLQELTEIGVNLEKQKKKLDENGSEMEKSFAKVKAENIELCQNIGMRDILKHVAPYLNIQSMAMGNIRSGEQLELLERAYTDLVKYKHKCEDEALKLDGLAGEKAMELHKLETALHQVQSNSVVLQEEQKRAEAEHKFAMEQAKNKTEKANSELQRYQRTLAEREREEVLAQNALVEGEEKLEEAKKRFEEAEAEKNEVETLCSKMVVDATVKSQEFIISLQTDYEKGLANLQSLTDTLNKFKFENIDWKTYGSTPEQQEIVDMIMAKAKEMKGKDGDEGKGKGKKHFPIREILEELQSKEKEAGNSCLSTDLLEMILEKHGWANA